MPALFILAFTESSFFPIPPDVLLIALSLSIPQRSFHYALVCSVGSVLGGCGGYAIGYFASEVGRSLIYWLSSPEVFHQVATYYGDNAFVAILIAAFTPIPYKVFTIAAGIFHESVSLWVLICASIVGRSARFFLVALLIYGIGPRIKKFLDRYFNLATVVFMVLLLGGFAGLGYLRPAKKEVDLEKIMKALSSVDPALRASQIEFLEGKYQRKFGFDPQQSPHSDANRRALQEIRRVLQQEREKPAPNEK